MSTKAQYQQEIKDLNKSLTQAINHECKLASEVNILTKKLAKDRKKIDTLKVDKAFLATARDELVLDVSGLQDTIHNHVITIANQSGTMRDRKQVIARLRECAEDDDCSIKMLKISNDALEYKSIRDNKTHYTEVTKLRGVILKYKEGVARLVTDTLSGDM